LSAFSRGGIDSYIGKASVHFAPTLLDDDRIEQCFLLKYVERNNRKSPLEKSKRSDAYNETQRWSIRQMAFYQDVRKVRQFETALLVNPSPALWNSFKLHYREPPGPAIKPYENHTHIPLQVFNSLTEDWTSYISALHRAAAEVKTDAAFTDPQHQRIGEADTHALESCVDLMELLQQAHYSLGNNITILEAVLEESKSRLNSDRDAVLFECGVTDVMRELRFHCNQVALITGSLSRTQMTISSLLSLRGS
jgi:hypothetical protein